MAQTRNYKGLAWMLGGAAAFGAYYALLRPKHLTWGATQEEFEGYLPGDELVPRAIHNATHAITIDAPPDYVWPWLMQLGQNKGGFYSYTALENLVGCHMKNSEVIHPEWQDLKAGDPVWFHPKAPTQQVLILNEKEHMVIGKVSEFVWGFHLHALPEHKTRFVVRGLGTKRDILSRTADIFFWEPAHFVMERKMMLTIKRLAEHWYKRATD